mmetsp:Transcript_44453/g.117424  ORF Transcript_44453/g.117424 Transcript_44453/m.117424 type:complete len:225 (-) Transcript_44453:342-1016(-)
MFACVSRCGPGAEAHAPCTAPPPRYAKYAARSSAAPPQVISLSSSRAAGTLRNTRGHLYALPLERCHPDATRLLAVRIPHLAFSLASQRVDQRDRVEGSVPPGHSAHSRVARRALLLWRLLRANDGQRGRVVVALDVQRGIPEKLNPLLVRVRLPAIREPVWRYDDALYDPFRLADHVAGVLEVPHPHTVDGAKQVACLYLFGSRSRAARCHCRNHCDALTIGS